MNSKKLTIGYWGHAHKSVLSNIEKHVDRLQIVDIGERGPDSVMTDAPWVCVMDTDISRDLLHPMESFAGWAHPPDAILILLKEKEQPPAEFDPEIDYLPEPISARIFVQRILRLKALQEHQAEITRYKSSLKLRTQELTELNKIGMALSAERDPDILLDMILSKAREITSADAGSLYFIESEDPKITDWRQKQLRFKLAQNDSISSSYREFVMPIEKTSMAGYAAITGQPLNIPDAYHLSSHTRVRHNRSFDERMGYRTRSVLCLPMKNHRGEVLGVLQLINRKKTWSTVLKTEDHFNQEVIPFDQRCVEMASSLAGQAAVSVENMQLYEEIKNLFEGFIVASVHAIEQRDPTTFGHSQRVAELTTGLATLVDSLDRGRFKEVSFSRDDVQQIKYAGLLHDFGKIGVRENVLVKAKKLYPEQLDMIRLRYDYIKQGLELRKIRKQLAHALDSTAGSDDDVLRQLETEYQQQREELERYLALILEANEPRVLEEGRLDLLQEIRHQSFQDNGHTTPFLTEDEFTFLSIPRGSLGVDERREIESHVTHTYNFLSRIPWSSNLKRVPDIAYAHHEKLDGKGYPRGLADQEIPLPSKMMTIADIFDALTAWDRPYKKAVPVDRALDIIRSEVNGGKLDSDLFQLFLDAKIYEQVERPD
jgi:HD-GYP domain-containing protein (c-di-GMP phosphodiesterase class II)